MKAFLISYDVSDNKKRNKIAKILEEYGKRIQYSVFYCQFSKKTLFDILSRVSKIIDKDNDSILAIILPQGWDKYVVGSLKNDLPEDEKSVF
ncbi:MAG: CRISPR-associated protein Cas2 [Thermotogota bacterium]|jgi:CRISPR-associated protein Cas2|nr:MAG: CRISPR-associated endoribonuclease Cas2 [bacterium 42_11]MDK2864854.1 CRISPR-associated protein Cas2 [Thermotogota bacterium]HCZ07030.1 CRISPR-associated endonuclease Cas2 [Thermotogota bacterium]